MAYLLDTNVLIAAKNNHYGFDFCPAFWSWLDESNGAGVVRSVERVYDELIERGDELSDWARARRPLFLPLSAEDVRAVAEVNRWANDSPDYDPAAKAEFADAADSFLVAQAKAGGHTIVTHERISDGRKRIKIPNAAAVHGVDWCTPFHMLRVEQARFVLGGAA
ncbi:MAG: DUF4411 family protein [Acidimicrobiales bacterium]|nr:DUF4411 family protein [Acidimicrobiales bacterium]